MAFTKIVGAGIHTLSNVNTHNINSSGIITATQFVGIFTGTDGDFSGDVTIDGNLTVNGTTTTLDTNLIDVDKIEVTTTGAIVGVAVTQNGSGDLVRLYDGSTQVVTVDDEGKVGVGTDAPNSELEVFSDTFSDITINSARTSGNIGALNFRKGGAAGGLLVAQYIVDTNGSHYFFSQGSPKLQITAGGEVQITGADDQNNLLVKGGSTHFAVHQDDTDGEVSLRAQDGSGSNNSKYMTFYTHPSGSATAERLRITSDGKVGIGTDSPTKNLQIGGDGVDSNNAIRFGKRISSSQTNLPLIGHHSEDGTGSGLALCATSSNGAIHFFTGNGGDGFGVGGNAERVRINAAGRVGIGTDDPEQRLHISGSGAGQNSLRIDSSTTAISFNNHSEFMGYIGNDSGKLFINAVGTVRTLSLRTNYQERLVITSTGNVGINSTVPANKLDVRLGAAWIYPNENGDEAVALKLGKLEGYLDSLNDILVSDDNDSVTNRINRYVGNWYFDRTTSPGATRLNAFQLKAHDSGGNIGNSFIIRDLKNTADSIKLWSNGNSFVGVTTDGTTRNFGIGTGSPTAPLVVSSSANTLGILTSTDDGANLDLFDNDTQSRIRTVDGRLHLYADFHGGVGSGNVSDSSIRFFVDGNNEKVRIASDGNVGIGSQSPSRKLSIVSEDSLGISIINGGSFATTGVHFEGSRNAGTGVVGNLQFYNRRNGGVYSNLRVNGNGEFNFNQSVGIGTDNVDGDRLRVHKDGLNQILQRWGGHLGSTAGQRFLELYTPATDDMNEYFRFQTGNAIKFRIDTKNALCINSTGLVGIGTDSPSHELDIESSSPVIEMKDNDAGDSRFQIAQSGAQTYLDMDVGNLGSSSLRFRFAGQEKVRFTNSGRVGIGTDSPGHELDIWSSSPAIRLVDNNPYESGAFGQIGQSGNVLQILADSGNTSGHGSVFFYSYNDNDSFNTYRISDNVHQWYISGVERARLHSNGNLGIGTNLPGSRLQVLGNIETKDTNGLQNLFVSDSSFKFSQSAAGWTSMDYTSTPILAWDYKSGPGDLFYIASGGNTPIADQMAIVVSDAHGFKVGKSGYDGSDFDVSSSNEFFRIGTSGKVLVNSTAISGGGADPQLSVESATGSNIGILQVHAGGGETNGDLSGIAFSHGTDGTVARPKAAIALNSVASYGKGELCFYVDNASDNNSVSSGDEKLRIKRTGGITFNGDTADDNALDDYEEGSYTPTATTGAGGNITGTTSFVLRYVKIGKLVQIFGRLHFSTSATNLSSFELSLPFANASSNKHDTSSCMHVIRGSGGDPVQGIRIFRVDPGASTMRMQNTNGQNNGDLGDTNPHINVNFSYFSA